MRNGLILFFVFFLVLQLLSCSSEQQENDEIVASINNYNLTLKEFQSYVSDELEMDSEFKLTREARAEFIEGLIRKELLIQEARRLALDQKESFIRTIERYWEATLIRELIEKKNMDIEEIAIVSQEEIERRYKAMKDTDSSIPSLEDMEEEIEEGLKDRKKTRLLKDWITSLKDNAEIEINEELLYRE
jgi:hypothetical protein